MRHSLLATMTALLMLGMCAVDLAGDVVAFPFCASDLDGVPVPLSAPKEGWGRPGPAAPGNDVVHFDDCFCCSRCVRSSTPFTLDRQVKVENIDVSSRTLHAPVLTEGLYRPPRAS